MLRKLVKIGIECSYTLINAAAYVMKEVRYYLSITYIDIRKFIH